MTTFRTALTALAALAALAACQKEGAHRPAPESRRIVTIGGNVTEAVFAVGAGAQVVGVDTSSLYPPEATQLPKVGYQRQISVEGVLSLQPDVVIATEDAGPPPAVAQLRAAGIEVVILTNAANLDGARERLIRIGEFLHKPTEAHAVVARMNHDLAELARALEGRADRPRVLSLYARGAGTLNVAGRGTAADAMLALAGATNAVTEFEGYRPLTSEGVVAATPDVILVPERGLASLGGVDGLLAQPGVGLTPAGRDRRVVALDDLKLLGFGPRTAEAARELAQALHPGLSP